MSCTLQGSSLLSPVRWCLLSTGIPMIKIRWSHNCLIFIMGIPILETAVLEISLKKLSVQWNELSAQSLKYVTNGGKVITPSHLLWRSSQELNTIWNTEKMVVILKQGPLSPKQYKTDIWYVQSSTKYSPLSWLWLFYIDEICWGQRCSSSFESNLWNSLMHFWNCFINKTWKETKWRFAKTYTRHKNEYALSNVTLM